jgi:hypothetical protein
VGSSRKTSSRRVVCWMAWSMERVGVVIVSERKSKAAAQEFEPGAAQYDTGVAVPLAMLEGFGGTLWPLAVVMVRSVKVLRG